MSFAYDVKAELCKVPINRSCCAAAEGCGVLLYASAFTANEVRIVTENDEFAARLPKLFQKAFSLRFDELPDKWSVTLPPDKNAPRRNDARQHSSSSSAKFRCSAKCARRS